MNTTDIALGIVVLVFATLYIFDKWNNNRTVAALTAAVKDKAADTQLVQLAHNMAVQVIPVNALPSIMDAVKTAGSLGKIIAPDDVDALIDAGVDLAGAIASGQPVTIADVVKALQIKQTVTVPKG